MFKFPLPPTERELDYYQWEVYGPLREHSDYRQNYFAAYTEQIKDPDELAARLAAFCDRWGLNAHRITGYRFNRALFGRGREGAK